MAYSNNNSPTHSHRLKKSASNKSSVNLFNYQTNIEVQRVHDSSTHHRSNKSLANVSTTNPNNISGTSKSRAELNNSNIFTAADTSKLGKERAVSGNSGATGGGGNQFEMEKDFLQKVRDRFHSNNAKLSKKNHNKSHLTNTSLLKEKDHSREHHHHH
mmetsp:Transcript_31284/g.28447  ORF Transcript_31284/g.28447 Transcript_31284/m.28447 type:complete len:158 (+) Transcript_31284:1137-1610(+)